jgi:hypothetical protein
MDIVDRFLEEGRKLVGERIWTEKRPNLRLISAESVTEVATAKPAFLFSVHVLGSGLIQTQNAMMAARTTADKKLTASLS